MPPNPQFPADLVTFTEEVLNGKLYFLYSGSTDLGHGYIIRLKYGEIQWNTGISKGNTPLK